MLKGGTVMHNGRPELPALPASEVAMLGACELRIQQLEGCIVVRPVGEIDLSNSDALGDRLDDLVDRGHVVLDLSGLSFLDSTALAALITVRKRAAGRGTSLHLAGAFGYVNSEPARGTITTTDPFSVEVDPDALVDRG